MKKIKIKLINLITLGAQENCSDLYKPGLENLHLVYILKEYTEGREDLPHHWQTFALLKEQSWPYEKKPLALNLFSLDRILDEKHLPNVQKYTLGRFFLPLASYLY